MAAEFIGKLYRLKTGKQFSQRAFAPLAGMSVGTFNSRTQGTTEWKLSEAVKISELIGISVEQFNQNCG